MIDQVEQTEQRVFCSNCGTELNIILIVLGPILCSEECLKDLQWKITQSNIGVEYSPIANEG